ncbi:MAG: 16S rRNA (guanine(966)-N(2))-methyltransferase RsmD [Anaerolineae bacterium]|nr:16S rRNA (guanine(966)-N(2))-methyltransferase RsmD [Anaerolineae bacterium]
MRVISGRAKGRKLATVPGDKTRPMMDRIKENLFNLLGPYFIPGTRWLDLFAGTGQVGIEALSRGASEVIFIDMAREAIGTIHRNLKHTQLTDGARVIRTEAFTFLRGEQFAPFDVIFVAPPQYREMWKEVLAIVDERPERYLNLAGIIVVQLDPRESEQLPLKGLALYDERTYGNTTLQFYERADTNEEE